MDRRTLIIAGAAAAALPLTRVTAQSFPARQVTLLIGFSAGGPTDLVFRALAESAARQLKQPVLVENRAGAGGMLPPMALKTTKPDGYVLAQAPIGVFRFPHMQKQPQFDPLRDFTWVINLTGYTFGIVVPAASPWKTFRDFIEDARRNPEKVTYGHTGTGTSPHLAVEEVAVNAGGVKFTNIPYKGSSELMTALLGGHVMAGSDSTGWAPHVESGKLRLLVTFGSKRTRRWPDVPTLDELGYKTVSDSPFGLIGPAGMDPAIVNVLHDAFRKALDEPKVRELLDRYDQPVIHMGPADYAAWARRTFESERTTIDRLGLKGSM